MFSLEPVLLFFFLENVLLCSLWNLYYCFYGPSRTAVGESWRVVVKKNVEEFFFWKMYYFFFGKCTTAVEYYRVDSNGSHGDTLGGLELAPKGNVVFEGENIDDEVQN